MPITPTNLPESISGGQTGHLAHSAAAYAAINAVTRRISGQVIDAVSEGAVNDGTTPTTTALNSAQALLPVGGGKLFLRRGSYALNTRTTITKQGFV